MQEDTCQRRLGMGPRCQRTRNATPSHARGASADIRNFYYAGFWLFVTFLTLFASMTNAEVDSDPDLTFDEPNSLHQSLERDSLTNAIDPLSIPVSGSIHRHHTKRGDNHQSHRRRPLPLKSAPLFSDDEDIFEGFQSGSGTDKSSETLTPPTIPTRTPSSIPTGALYFRVTLTLLGSPYEPSLADRHSDAFRRLADDLVLSLEQIYNRLPGQQVITVISFSPTSTRNNLLTSFDVGSRNNNDQAAIKSVLERMIDSGYAGRHKVSREAFSFRRFGVSPIPTCESHEFTCKNDECLDARRVCDGRRDCRDGSDEDDCPDDCPSGQFKCGSDECIDERRKCDSRRDCRDGSDEANCATDHSHAQLTPVPRPSVPDPARSPCSPGEFLCDGRRCIAGTKKCNGAVDCIDRTDESNCTSHPKPRECQDDQFQCSSGECIQFFQQCDLVVDCPDGEDESFCPCSPDEYRCDDKTCIDLTRHCDGVPDCPDRSDERNCTRPGTVCPPGEFRCENGSCIDMLRRCDGRRDCRDGSDEVGCPPISHHSRRCSDNEFRCVDGSRCIPIENQCNGRRECPDGSDEKTCPCRPGQFKCENNFCIDQTRRCDGYNDCQDKTDEKNCPGVCQPSEFRCRDGTCIPSSMQCNRQYDCRDGSDEQECPSTTCRSDQYRCSNGTCLNIAKRCDGVRDCPGGEDEARCGYCTANQFRCRDGLCISNSQRCDGKTDCRDSSDERECPAITEAITCKVTDFVCRDGSCVNQTSKCDGRNDCKTAEDESICRNCQRREFTCNNGRCIDSRRRCDGRSDCLSGEDEVECPSVGRPCQPGDIVCRNGTCLDASKRCDGVVDCPYGIDEANCPTRECRTGEFKCADGSCINSTKKCDGTPDCRDSTDEMGCDICGPGQFRCDNNMCIPNSNRCNRRYDCTDGSDERDCVRPRCSTTEFQCNDGACIESFKHCDRNHDCADRSDEFNCGCQPNQYQCASGECVNVTARCDGRADCRDRSDETDCRNCSPTEYYCANGQCIDRTKRCDGKFDCSDFSDETDCPTADGGVNIRVYPERQTIRQGREVVFRCRDEGPRRSPVKWSRADNRAMPPSTRDIRGRLTMPSIQPEHSGVYICAATSVASGVTGAQKAAFLTVQPFTPPTHQPTRPPGSCARSEATCQNGECIPKDYVCDGDYDCTDRSDESTCGYSRCEPNEFQCQNQKCVLKVWRCDGDNDCGDNSDEKTCTPNAPGSPCRYDEFQCNSGDQCIPKSFQCDGEFDCQDKTDEIGCSAPTIIQLPPDTLTVAEGDTATITCSAVGNPTPVISWRLNWGHIPPAPRVTIKSENGHGTVTIRDAIETDGGAWSCEAINSKDSVLATPDCILVVKSKAGICLPPVFNERADSPSDCLKCFCFGISSTCYSSNLFVLNNTLQTEIAIKAMRKERDGSYVDVSSQYPPSQEAIEYKSDQKEFAIDEQVRQGAPAGIYYYWSLPPEFLGNQLNSYGGFIRFTFRYKSPFIPRPSRIADLIIKGNGITLYHILKTSYGSQRDNNVAIRLWEGDWFQNEAQGRGDTPVVESTTREDIMMVLQNVESILIRASYDEEVMGTSLINMNMDTASLNDKNAGMANYVEKCSCPPGYTGSSCENCAVGYSRRSTSSFLGECIAATIPCNCHGHSDLCDPLTGECLNCQHNAEGRQCDRCKRGFYGDPRRGTAQDCQNCPCPLITQPNQFSPTCFLERDGQVTCDACPIGYEGRRCERCAPGYEGNPNTPGSQCQARGAVQCDPVGSLTLEPSPTTGLCQCKPYATGARCDQCKANTYFLNPGSPSGCIDCFCMGITKACSSSTWHRSEVTLRFTNSADGVSLSNLQRSHTIERDLNIDTRTGELVFRNYGNEPQQTYYWKLPEQFLKDKVSSYGGKLNYSIRYEPGRQSVPNNDPDVQLKGNGIILVYKHTERLRPSILQTVSIPMFESSWLRSDGQPATREHFLMALANLSVILIKATYSIETQANSLHSVTMETATEHATGRERALAVEQCRCPIGYKGLSCEDCESGYTRSGAGLYLGLCEPCFCNGHSSDCDPENGVCKNCQHNTVGDFCEDCAPGYVGTPSTGTPNDCQVNIEPVCGCDVRGSTGTECDFRSNCRCKPNVQGKNCNVCKEGFFHLDSSHNNGCMPCFCFGVTQQCSSSSYYRDQINMQLLDLTDIFSHNFQLTNRYRSRTITDGIIANPTVNEISFASFSRDPSQQETMFWSLPAPFLGSKLASYGGKLVYTQTYSAGDEGGLFDDADVEITGNGIAIFYVNSPTLSPQETRTYEIELKETNWQRVDSRGPTAATREDFMKVLANVEALLIRASFHSRMEQTKLKNIMMDTAKPQSTGQSLALHVEQCACPPGYIGLSCEECAPSYIRDTTGPGLGRCTRCNCNGHSESCDATTGRCVRCRHNTMGDNCERCVEGYFGDATRGAPEDCKPCPCPLTMPTNQFSSTCFLDTDGQSTCNACPPGYNGRNCEACSHGYRGNPLQPGSRCEPSRGTVQTIRVRVEEPHTQRVPAGASVTFRCTGVSQVSDVSYTLAWTKEGGEFPSRRSTEASGVLTIPNVRPEDSGTYVCTGSDLHSVDQKRVTLIVEGAGRPTSPRVRIEPHYLDVKVGDPVEFQCIAEGFPEPELTWTGGRNNQLNPQSSFADGIFRIPAARKSDEAEYFCNARNSAGTESLRTLIFVRGEDGPADVEQPRVTITPSHQDARPGETVRFECRVTGNPTPSITWSYADGPLPRESSQNGGMLQLPRVSQINQGIYVCTASNIHGTAQQQVRLSVDDGLGPPTARVEPERQTLIQGSSGELRCISSGNPTPVVHWSKVGGHLSQRHKTQGDTLIIEDVITDDRGLYVCKAENRDGTAQASAIIEVDRREVPAIELYPESTQVVRHGSSVLFQCRVSAGVPTPTVEWTRSDGSPFTTNTEILKDGVIRFNRVTGDDEGLYICTAENEAGRVTAQASLQVQGSPSLRIIQSSPYRVRPHEKVKLECRADGEPQPSLSWHKLQTAISGHSPPVEESRGLAVLEIARVTALDSGVYACRAKSPAGESEERIHLIVEDTENITPEITIEDLVSSVEPGADVEIRCFVRGTSRDIVLKWSRADNEPLPVGHRVENGVLYIQNAQERDNAEYVCSGYLEGVAILTARARLAVVEAQPLRREESTFVGASVELTCPVNLPPSGSARIDWTKDSGPLPDNCEIINNRIRIRNARLDNAGRYICHTSSRAGRSREFVILTVRDVPTIEVRIEPSREMVNMGDTLDLRCRVTGDPTAQIQWSKLEQNGPFPDNVRIRNSILTINGVKSENGGVYRCSVDGQSGSFSDSYVLAIQVPPTISADEVETRTAPIASTVVLDCQTNLDPPVAYTWSKQGGSLAPDATVEDGVLTIRDVKSSYAGTYICTAKSHVATLDIPTILVVTGAIPRFSQNPVSYMKMNTLQQAYLEFDVELSFKPDEPNGLLLFNGKEGDKDFISLGLSDGHVEFRFDLGSGAAIVRSPEPVEMGKWHVAHIKRDKKEGTLKADDQPEVRGMAPGRFQGLDLSGPLYIGGVHDFSDIPKSVGFTRGFTGCISKLKIRQEEFDLMRTAEEHGTMPCEGCSVNPCLHGGVCQEALTATGYLCICPPGFSGQECEKVGEACYPGVCGEGRCINKPGGGFDCYCPFGRTGIRCEREILILEPSFSDDAFVSYTKPEVQRAMRFNMRVKPRFLDDGILLYCAQNEDGQGDFTSLALKNKTIEFRFDTGSGPAVITSPEPIQSDQWVDIKAERDMQMGTLTINNKYPVRGVSPGHTRGLNLGTELYIGGIDKQKVKVNPLVGVAHGFDGCVAHVEVNDVKIDLVGSVVDAANVEDCGGHSPCETQPCKNGGRCHETGGSYKCRCAEGYRGRNCEEDYQLCDVISPCKNGGSCIGNAQTYKCRCPIGFKGTNCEDVTKFTEVASVRGDGYLALDRSLLPHTTSSETEEIRLQFMTTQSNGLLFFHGQKHDTDGKGQDFMAVAIADGHLEFSFELGSGPATIRSTSRVDDGRRHNVIIKRTGQHGGVEIDGTEEFGGSKGILQVLNAPGDIYIGGVPKPGLMTGDRYMHGFQGCLWDVEIQNSGIINLFKTAKSGANVLPCGDTSAIGDDPYNDFVN